jgi:hypothetical protein
LASPTLSLFIPGITGRSVVYGHPFETINADEQKQQVIGFYNGNMAGQKEKEFLVKNRIRFIIFGSREKLLGQTQIEPDWQQVYTDNDIKVYEFKP